MTIAAKKLFLSHIPILEYDDVTNRQISSRDLSKLEEEFFTSVQLSNGVFKTTYLNRMDDLNKAIMHLVPNNAKGMSSYLDIGVSSGIATYEWCQALKAAGIRPKMVATDVTVSAYLIRMFKGIYVLADKNGYPLQYDIFGWACRNYGRRLDFITGYFLFRSLLQLNFSKKRLIKKICAGESKGGVNCKEVYKIKLISPSLKNNLDIEFVDDDIMQEDPKSFKAQFDMVRVANLLNLCYFSESQILKSLQKIKERFMKPGSLLLVVRTEPDSLNHATLFSLEDRGDFRVIFRYGNGSEIENLVLSLSK